MKFYGQLEKSRLENLSSDPTGVAAGYVYWNTTSNVVRVYDGAAWANLATGSNSAKQIVIGTAQTASTSITSSTFAAWTSNPTITFTATFSGKYKIYGRFVAQSVNNDVTAKVRIAATAGTPTVNFSQESADYVSAANLIIPHSPFIIVTLTSGTSYTFRLEGLVSAGTLTLRNDLPTNGQALIAQQIE